MDVRKTVVNSFVISRVDYCNGLLAGVPCYQLSPTCPDIPFPCNDAIVLRHIRNCRRYYYYKPNDSTRQLAVNSHNVMSQWCSSLMSWLVCEMCVPDWATSNSAVLGSRNKFTLFSVALTFWGRRATVSDDVRPYSRTTHDVANSSTTIINGNATNSQLSLHWHWTSLLNHTNSLYFKVTRTRTEPVLLWTAAIGIQSYSYNPYMDNWTCTSVKVNPA